MLQLHHEHNPLRYIIKVYCDFVNSTTTKSRILPPLHYSVIWVVGGESVDVTSY